MCSEHLVLELRCHKQTFLCLSWQLMTLVNNSIFWPQASKASVMREPYLRIIPCCTALHCSLFQYLHLYLESPFSIVELECLSNIYPCEQKRITIEDSNLFFFFSRKYVEIILLLASLKLPTSNLPLSKLSFFPNTLPITHGQDQSKFIILSMSLSSVYSEIIWLNLKSWCY